MASVYQQVNSANSVICQNISTLTDRRDLLSQNILAQLRNLIEGIAVRIYLGDWNADFRYQDIDYAMQSAKSKSKTNFIPKFHSLTQQSSSHFTFDGDNSERLMLKYYEYLVRLKKATLQEANIEILENLDKFPLDLDPALVEYHCKIAIKIQQKNYSKRKNTDRYYIHKIIPFFVGLDIFYEVTFYRATNRSSKSDRIIGFTDIDINASHAVTLEIENESINALGREMPIILIRSWKASIRPCEIDNFAKIFGMKMSTKANSSEYAHIMHLLSTSIENFYELAIISENHYKSLKDYLGLNQEKKQIFSILDKAREIVKYNRPGKNVLRYLMLHMRNNEIKAQYSIETCRYLSGLNLKFSCIPFDQMPLCTSLAGHNPRFLDLLSCIDGNDRTHELLARKVKTNVESSGIIYTPLDDCSSFGELQDLIKNYNSKLYPKHVEQRKLVIDKGHLFINGYETEIVSIINKIKELTSKGIDGYQQAVEKWLAETERGVDDPYKLEALKVLFNTSLVSLIYGAAGTGKSTLLDHISKFFNSNSKLFLAHTNPAIDNLQRKITAQNSEFRTIKSHIFRNSNKQFDILIIDECSTVSNADILSVLDCTKFSLLILVGDVYQIEAIQFGNWFNVIRSFVKEESAFELKTPFRTKNHFLLTLWDRVRNNSDDIAEIITQGNYSSPLNVSLFEPQSLDEIILCLNYDGLYGINNVNRFLQSSNNNIPAHWRDSTYKVGDPVLFFDAERFKPVIYNNLKGWIVGILHEQSFIQFDVKLDRPLTEFDTLGVPDIDWIGNSTVRFKVFDMPGSSDEDDDSLNTIVPFQVAYAVSIHKAQGLEYDSVKIVITDSNEEDITHSIFYTAITRARENLKIFWSPETQQSILKRLKIKKVNKDVYLLKSRHNV